MKLEMNACLLLALLTASSFPKSWGLKLPSKATKCRTVSASFLTMPEPILTNGKDDEPDEHEHFREVMGDKGPRNQNPVVGDTAFLRKRTSDILRITADGYQNNNGSSDVLGRKMKVDKKTFNWLIDSWAFSGELDAADKAYSLLVRMEELDASEFTSIRPDVRSYTKVINAIARSGRSDAGDMAEKILNRMESLYLSGKNVAAKPNTFTYTAVVEAYANSGAPGTAARAAEICEVMTQMWEDGRDTDVTPTSRTFNAVINAYAKSGEPDAAQQAENLFDQMVEIFESGNAECKPTTFNYNAVICALANSGEEGSAKRAEEFLERMVAQSRDGDEDAKPTTVSFNAVIDAYAKSGEDGAAERSEQLLRHMEQLFESGENVAAKPNARSFNTVINAYAKSRREDAALKAEGVLNLMEELYEAGNEDVRPDVHSFSSVINAWAKSQKTGKAERARNLFREMRQLYEAGNRHLRPNVVAYNAVLNACAFTNGDVSESNRAVEIAHAVLQDMEKSGFALPDQVTYGTFFKVCSNQMPECDARDQVVEMIFNKCRKDGQVGHMVLQELKSLTQIDQFVRLTGRGRWEDIKFEEIPEEWRRNVVEGKWRRRQRRANTD